MTIFQNLEIKICWNLAAEFLLTSQFIWPKLENLNQAEFSVVGWFTIFLKNLKTGDQIGITR